MTTLSITATETFAYDAAMSCRGLELAQKFARVLHVFMSLARAIVLAATGKPFSAAKPA